MSESCPKKLSTRYVDMAADKPMLSKPHSMPQLSASRSPLTEGCRRLARPSEPRNDIDRHKQAFNPREYAGSPTGSPSSDGLPNLVAQLSLNCISVISTVPCSINASLLKQSIWHRIFTQPLHRHLTKSYKPMKDLATLSSMLICQPTGSCCPTLSRCLISRQVALLRQRDVVGLLSRANL